MILLILVSLFAATAASPLMQTLSLKDDGSYRFHYETGKESGSHSRTEVRHPDGVIEGKYSYEDPNGAVREVQYRADDSGYVANGDVSVDGAPKGQFPVATEEPQDTSSVLEAAKDDISPDQNEPDSEEPGRPEVPSSAVDGEPPPEDDMKDLSLDEPTADDPPEAFPIGFFNRNFQGLRRLPEPTPEKAAVPEVTTETSELPSTEEKDGGPPAGQTTDNNGKPNSLSNVEFDLFMPMRPFQPFSPHTDASLLHQPVYVYSYQQPDSYGYHYFF